MSSISAPLPASWHAIASLLRRWHDAGDRDAAGAALAFIESELRLMVPPIVRRRWPADLIDDAIRAFLLKFLEIPLPPDIERIAAWIHRAFRNHCIDLYLARTRLREQPVLDLAALTAAAPSDEPSPVEIIGQRQRAARLHDALGQLEIVDRVALKLEHAPEWLTDEEVDWLARRQHIDAERVREEIAAARDTHALTLIFDPEDGTVNGTELRRDRMERFRKRRARAREKLRALLQDVVA